MGARERWVSHPHEWQPLLDRWAMDHPGRFKPHAWTQLGGQQVRALTFGDTGAEKPVRILVTVPHAHEPASTAATVDLASQLVLRQCLDGTPSRIDAGRLLERCLLTLIPDTNSQGRSRSPRRVWDGEVKNDDFYKFAFGEAANGERFGRYPEWRWEEHKPRRTGIVYEEVEPGLWVESNTSRRSTHTRAMDDLFARYRYTHFLDMHQHEGYEATLLPAEFDDLTADQRGQIERWSDAVLSAWKAAGIEHKGRYVPYRGQPRQQFFKDYWKGRCPGMLRLTVESRNNRHTDTDEPTTLEHQLRSTEASLSATLRHLTGV